MNTPDYFEDYFATLLLQLTVSDVETLAKLYLYPSIKFEPLYIDMRGIEVGSRYKSAEAAYGRYACFTPVRQTANLKTADASDPPI